MKLCKKDVNRVITVIYHAHIQLIIKAQCNYRTVLMCTIQEVHGFYLLMMETRHHQWEYPLQTQQAILPDSWLLYVAPPAGWGGGGERISRAAGTTALLYSAYRCVLLK